MTVLSDFRASYGLHFFIDTPHSSYYALDNLQCTLYFFSYTLLMLLRALLLPSYVLCLSPCTFNLLLLTLNLSFSVFHSSLYAVYIQGCAICLSWYAVYSVLHAFHTVLYADCHYTFI